MILMSNTLSFWIEGIVIYDEIWSNDEMFYLPNKEKVMSDAKPSQEIAQEIVKFDKLEESMRDAEKSRTLEEQVAYLKSQGIDPSKTYAKWDDDKEDE